VSNTKNLEEVILRFKQQMMHMRENLLGPGSREMFESANRLGRKS
jgi:hypothetical protein